MFLLERVIGYVWGLRLWSLLGLAFFGWAFVLSLKSSRGWTRALQVLLLAALVISARPLQDWAFGNTASEQAALPHLNFTRINNVEQAQP